MLSQTCIAALYIMVSVGYYWSQANLGLLVMTGVDSLILIAFIVCAVTLGKPMSFLNCYVIGKSSAEVDTMYANTFVTATVENLNKSTSSLGHWAGVTRSNCLSDLTQLLGNTILLYKTGCQPFGLLANRNDCQRSRNDCRDGGSTCFSRHGGLSICY